VAELYEFLKISERREEKFSEFPQISCACCTTHQKQLIKNKESTKHRYQEELILLYAWTQRNHSQKQKNLDIFIFGLLEV
jgi:hypothetical protein